MPGFFFTNTFLLAGLAALGAPVLIHLLLKQKKKRLRFSTIQFFLKQDEQSSQRRKLRNWFLLALRLLIFTLLVLGFARPYLPQGQAGGAGQKKRQVIFIVDRSASMQAADTGVSRWVQAKKRIEQALGELKLEDRAALIGCSSHADILSGFAPPTVINKLLGDLQPAFGSSDLSEGLRQASRLVSMGDASAVSTICVVSDFQRGACGNLAASPIRQNVELKLLGVGDLLTPNLAVSRLQTEVREDSKPHVVLANFSDEDSPSASVDLMIDGKKAFSRSIGLKSGASTNVEISIPQLKSGWHDLRAQLQTKDAFALDDSCSASIFIPEPLRVWVAETRPSKRAFEEESFFLTTALDPTNGSTNSVHAAFHIVKASPEELMNKLPPIQSQVPCDLIVLPGLKQIPSGSGAALVNFLRAGGGVLLFLGEGISANRYNNEFRDWLPLQLGNFDVAQDVSSPWRLGEFDTNVTMFAAFRLPNSGDLRIPAFTKRFLVTASESSFAAANYDDGIPLVTVREVGRGRVAVVNTSADTSWNDWPKHKTYVPWLHGLGKYLAQKSNRGAIQAANSFISGNDIEIELGAAAKKTNFKLQTPGGKMMAITSDEQGRLRDGDFTAPGVYSLRDEGGVELQRWAANVPPQESDLAANSLAEFEQQIVRAIEPQKTTLAAGLFGATSNQKEFWRVLLLGVLALLFIEVFVANRTLA